MKRIICFLLAALLIMALAACHPREKLDIVVDSADSGSSSAPADTDAVTDDEESPDSSEGLRLNRAILENIGGLFRDILRDEPNLKQEYLSGVDVAVVCFSDPEKPYSYILFVTQYLPYDEYAAEAIKKCDIRCAGIYTTVKELFPDFVPGEGSEAFFDKPGVENFEITELRDYGIAYYADFYYEDMSFQIWGGTEDSPAVISVEDTVMVEVPTENEELINTYYNDKVYPDGIGCAAAIEQAKTYRISHGGSDCAFRIGREGIIDAWDKMNLPDEKVYIVSPELDWETERAEGWICYYVGYTSGQVYERHDG